MPIPRAWIDAVTGMAGGWLPRAAMCPPEVARARFDDALKAARNAYGRLAGRSGRTEFVHPAWQKNVRDVESYFLRDFDMAFVGHPVINSSMVFTNLKAHTVERQFLKSWRDSRTVARYVAGGLNPLFIRGRKQRQAVVANSVHHVYHLARFERATRRPIDSIKTVVEFGGGYGNMARIVRNFGALSRYTIVDLPVFSCIQYVVLCAVAGEDRVKLMDRPGATADEGKVNLVPLGSLDETAIDGDLFLSTWALSESTEAAYRYVTGRGWFGARSVLLAYNREWTPWRDDEPKDALERLGHSVAAEPIGFLDGNHYLFSTR